MINLLPGRVLIEKSRLDSGKERLTDAGIVVPATAYNPRETTSHTGRVVAMGPPACTKRRWSNVYMRWVGGGPVKPGFRVGDEVVYVYALCGTEDNVRATWWDGKPAAIVAQEEVIGVLE